MNIVVLDGFALNPGDLSWAALESQGNCVIYDKTPAEKILSRIGSAEIVVTNKTLITAEIINNSPNLRYIGVLATGYNNIDIKAAKDAGIVVTNIPAYSTEAVAQFVFALLLELCHHVGEHSRGVHEGDWIKSPEFSYWKYPLVDLQGKTMGIVGLGQIGKAVARIASALLMNVIAYSRTPQKIDGVRLVSLEELLAEADVVSLHCPLNEDTKGLINKNTLGKMKKTAMLINTSRGPVVVEDDLKEALNNDDIAGAAVDVVSEEPMKPYNPLLKAKNIIITPHIAWASLECRERLMAIAANNIKNFIAGNPVNVVN